MNIDDIKQLIVTGESNTVEFKRSTAKLKSAAETLCAFLNGNNEGSVFIGVADNGEIVGQNVTDNTKLEIANILKKFEPTANITVNYISISKDKCVILFQTNPDLRCIPYSFNGRAYERKESDTHLMNQGRYQQLLLSRHLNPHSWESQLATGILLNDLDQQEIAQTMQYISKNKRIDTIINNDNIEDNLKRLKLIEKNHLINAAVVLFVQDPSGDYMQCVLRMARFKGTEKRDFIDSRHVFGNAFKLLIEAENFINRNTAIASRVSTGKLARDEQSEYPFHALREALINAICHRDYSSAGGAITITIYDDRLEIANTGTLPIGITFGDLKKTHTSHPRNPRIVNVFYRRGLIEAMGIGTQEIIKTCLDANMKEPDFFEQAGNFVVRLWSGRYNAVSSIGSSELTDRQKKILEILHNKGELAPHEILKALDETISDRTLRRDLQLLKEKKYVDNKGQMGPKTKWFVL